MNKQVNRTTPSRWAVQSNDGTNIVAYNSSTGESFNGTTVDFNNIFKTTTQKLVDIQGTVDVYGNLIGITSNETGKSLPILTSEDSVTAGYLGDSMTFQNQYTSSYQSFYQDVGYFTWLNAYSGQTFELVNSSKGGVNGDTTTLMLDRMDKDVLSYDMKYCFVLAGFNDINNGVAADTIISNLTTIYKKLISANITVIALAVLPSSVLSSTPKQESLGKVNQFIRRFAAVNNGIMFIDTYTPLADQNTGYHITNLLNGDNMHPTPKGAQLLGKTIWNAVKTYFTPKAWPVIATDIISANNLTGNMSPNPTMKGTAGSLSANVTGVISDGFNTLAYGAGCAMVGSKVARTDYPNWNWQQLVLTGVAGVNTDYRLYKNTIAIPAYIPAGSKVYLQVEVNVTAISGCTLSQLWTRLKANGTLDPEVMALSTSGNAGLTELGTFVLRTPDLQLAANSTTMDMWIQASLSNTAGSCTIQIGKTEIRLAS